MKTKQWHERKSRDIYRKKATAKGFVARSAFKIVEIEKKYNFIKKSKSIIELGASPGGWTQVILDIKKNHNFKFVCIDINDLKISLDKNHIFINKDFNNSSEIIKIIDNYFNDKFDLILSDMSPNTTGHNKTDHLKIIQLADQVLEFSKKYINQNGTLILKIFQGSNEKDFVSKLKTKFKIVKYFKPISSRQTSSEIYLICSNNLN